MWVMLSDAWLSIVADRDDRDFLLVRSRKRGAVAEVFGVEEQEDLEADYQFRAFVHRDHVAGAMAREVQRVMYDNFKNSVKDEQLHKAYTQVWSVGWRMQLDNQDKGMRRRLIGTTMPETTAGNWPPESCSWCQEEIDHAFHAPEPGQPVDVCEQCWSMNGKEVLNDWYQESLVQEGDQEEADAENQSFGAGHH